MKCSFTVLLAILLCVDFYIEGTNAQRRRSGRRRNRLIPIDPVVPIVPIAPVVPTVPLDCGPIPHVVNGQGLETGNTVNYACQPGFRLEGTNVITCIDGRWTVAPRCVRELCVTPPNIAFANPPQITNSGTRATYTCISGYVIRGSGGQTSSTVDCNTVIQTWPTLPECELVSATQGCPAPPIIDNASRQISGNIAIYTCDTGYIQVAGTPSVLTCIGTNWMGGTPACTRNPNVTPPPTRCTRAPPCGGPNVNRPDVADSYVPGSKIVYTCSNGYRIAGQNDNNRKTQEVECKSDGTWTNVPNCEPVDCGTPRPGQNTNIVVTSATTFGSTYSYSCINLYVTSNPLTATCQADGNWSIGGPSCTIKVCPFSAIPAITNGAASVTSNTDTPVGQNVSVTCNTNYRVAPPITGAAANTFQTITCQENGTFTTPRTCVYFRPTSCKDHFQRDNRIPTRGTAVAAETVTIDTDGPGPAVEATVTCLINTNGQVCTNIAPNSGASLGTVALNCQNGGNLGSTTFSQAVQGGGVITGSSGFGICGKTTVGYPLSATQIQSVISSSNSCQQKVTSTCSGAIRLFFALLRNGDIQATAYAQKATAFDGSAPANTPLSAIIADPGVCDCYYTAAASSDCQQRGCTCSHNTAASGSDTVTIPLTPNNVDFITDYAILTAISGTTAPAAITPGTAAANALVVTIGNIECCETVTV